MTLLVSAGLLVAGAVMALKLPRVMECGAAAPDEDGESAESAVVRLPAQSKSEARPTPVEQAG